MMGSFDEDSLQRMAKSVYLGVSSLTKEGIRWHDSPFAVPPTILLTADEVIRVQEILLEMSIKALTKT